MFTKFVAWLKGVFGVHNDQSPKLDSVPPGPVEETHQQLALQDPAVVLPANEFVEKMSEFVLNLTGSFEGEGFTEVSGNFDGQGLSCGVLQWCLGQGSLQEKILRPWIKKHGSIDALGIFPRNDIDRLAQMNASQALGYAASYIGYGPNANWKAAWKKFMGRKDVIELQVQAAQKLLATAFANAENWGFKNSARAICFFFDVATQNGALLISKPTPSRVAALSYASQAKGKNPEIWKKAIATASDEQLCLFQAAYLRARKSKARWFQDVFARKGTLALGVGVVHGANKNINPQLEMMDS